MKGWEARRGETNNNKRMSGKKGCSKERGGMKGKVEVSREKE
jgi:hypothetical protein